MIGKLTPHFGKVKLTMLRPLSISVEPQVNQEQLSLREGIGMQEEPLGSGELIRQIEENISGYFLVRELSYIKKAQKLLNELLTGINEGKEINKLVKIPD